MCSGDSVDAKTVPHVMLLYWVEVSKSLPELGTEPHWDKEAVGGHIRRGRETGYPFDGSKLDYWFKEIVSSGYWPHGETYREKAVISIDQTFIHELELARYKILIKGLNGSMVRYRIVIWYHGHFI